MLKMMYALFITILLLPSLTACQKNSQQEVKSNSRDGLLGITETNPNQPMSPTYHTYTDDVRLMSDAIKRQFPTVRNSTIRINGATAYVVLNMSAGTSAEEMARIQQEANTVLNREMPRYHMNVTVSAK